MILYTRLSNLKVKNTLKKSVNHRMNQAISKNTLTNINIYNLHVLNLLYNYLSLKAEFLDSDNHEVLPNYSTLFALFCRSNSI